MSSGINRASRNRQSGWRSHPEVSRLRSHSDRNATAALASFIEKARRDNPLNVPDWEAAYWPFPARSRASSSGEGGLHFSINRAVKGSSPAPFPEPFFSFVKALICHYEQRSDKGFAASQSQGLIAAARYLYAQFGAQVPNPCDLTWSHFEAAAGDAAASMGEGAVNIGSKLAFIARSIDDLGISIVGVDWRNPLKRQAKHDVIGPVADRRRQELLPSTAVLDALADISRRDDLDPRDLVVQRAIDLLVCTGFRINECLALPRQCLVEEPELDDIGEPLLDRFGKPATRVGLRYWPEKGSSEMLIKWVPTALADIVKRAVCELLALTEPYAAVAEYQRRHPGRTLLGAPWDELPGDHLLSSYDVAAAVGLAERGGAQFIKMNDIPFVSIRAPGEVKASWYVRKDDLLARLFERSQQGNVLRRGEGVQDLADCLFLLPLRYLHRGLREGVRGTVAQLKDAQANVYLVGLSSQSSVFERLGYADELGQPLRATSHQFRHWLTTLALEEGLNQVEVARWMGRRDVSQNDSYDHRTAVQRARRVTERLRADEAAGPVADATRSIKDPVRREEFVANNSSTAHVTDLGLCVHPWDALPCQEHGACADCFELRVEKGDRRSLTNARANLGVTQAQIAVATAEHADDTDGADRWLEAHKRTEAGLKKIIAVHEDPTIPDGWIVQVATGRPTTATNPPQDGIS